MAFKTFIFSPLDQFEILPIFSLNLGFADFTITNVNVILVLIFFFLISLFFLIISIKDYTISIQLNNWPIVFNMIYNIVKDLIIKYTLYN